MKKYIPVLILVVAVGVLVYRVVSTAGPGGTPVSALDTFGKCLASKGATMYGAYWCPHCQNEKKTLGEAMTHVTYVECTQETDLCAAKKIEGYPTWILGDGTRLEGEQGIEGLAKATGCPLPQ